MSSYLVVAVAVALIYRIGREVFASQRHLTDEELADFWAGRLKATPSRQRQASEHLGQCQACRDRLDQVRRTEAGPGVEAPLIERRY